MGQISPVLNNVCLLFAGAGEHPVSPLFAVLLAVGVLVLVLFVVVLAFAVGTAVRGVDGPPPSASVRAPTEGFLPLGLHFTLVLLLSIASFFGGLVLLTVCLANWGLRFPFNFIVGGAMGIVFPQVLFGELLSARCPSCRGRSFLSWGRHMNYVCRDCSYVHVTGVSRGGARRKQSALSDASAARYFAPGSSVRTGLSFVYVLVVLFMYYSALTTSPLPAPHSQPGPQSGPQSGPIDALPGA